MRVHPGLLLLPVLGVSTAGSSPPLITYFYATHLDGTKDTEFELGETVRFYVGVQVQSDPTIISWDLVVKNKTGEFYEFVILTNRTPLEVRPNAFWEIVITWENGLRWGSWDLPRPDRYRFEYSAYPTTSTILLDIGYKPDLVGRIVSVSKRSVAWLEHPILYTVKACLANAGIEPLDTFEVGLGYLTPVDGPTASPRVVSVSTVDLRTPGLSCSVGSSKGKIFDFTFDIRSDPPLSLLSNRVAIVLDPHQLVRESNESNNVDVRPLPTI